MLRLRDIASTALVLALGLVVDAFPASSVQAADDPRFTQWQAPGPTDSRGPCPGLNSLANHGFINRNGRALTYQNVLDGSKKGLNMGADFSTVIYLAGLLASPNLLATTFDLSDLSSHNFPIEHDGSLSREDAALGDQTPLNQRNYQQFITSFDGLERTSIQSSSKAKIKRVQDQRARNPQFTYGIREFILSYGETGLYMQTMNDSTHGTAPIKYVRSLFEQQKLPYDLGWRPSPTEITLTTLGSAIFQLFAASGESAPEGFNVTVDSYKNLFEPAGPFGVKLENAAKRLGIDLGGILGL